MLIKYQIRNNFETTTATTVNGDVILSKNITIPLNTNFFPVDYEDDLEDIIIAERKKATNPNFDSETIKYLYNNSNNDLYIKFRFWDTVSSSYDIKYENSGILTNDILKNTNGFRKSFFRLYFYDSNDIETNSLIFTEDIDVDYTTKPEFKFNRLYWLRNDKYFTENSNSNRTIYMEARFFNAKTGVIKKFINTPLSITDLLTIDQYSNPNNHGWRYSPITLRNPKINNGEYNFFPIPNVGANTSTVITLSEFIIK